MTYNDLKTQLRALRGNPDYEDIRPLIRATIEKIETMESQLRECKVFAGAIEKSANEALK